MPTIEFSAGLTSGLAQRVSRLGENVNNAGIQNCGIVPNGLNSYNNNNTAIAICTGVRPSSGLLNYTNTIANALVVFFNNSYGSGFSSPPSTASGGNLIINTNYVAATATGTATWIAIMSFRNGMGGGGTNLNVQSVYGNIGGIGSGADLEISSNAIVSGQFYKINNLQIQFPSSWTY